MKRLSVLVAVIAFACVATAQSIPAKLMALHPDKERIECKFTEVRVNPNRNKTEQREGKLVYQAPNDLRLDYTKPAGDYLQITEEKLEQCTDGKVQSTKVKGRNNRYSRYRATLLSCLAGDVEKAADLNDATSECKKVDNKYVCTITADDASSKDIEQIKVEYDVATGRVLTITLTEGNGNYATYTTHP